MLSLSGFLFPNTNGNSIPRHDSWQTEFTGRLDRRLSFVFVSLFALVVLVGGTSLYLLSSHLLKSDVIARQSEQVHIVEQIDRHLQSFTSEIQLAQLQSRAVAESFIPTSMKDFETLLTLYKQAGGAERNIQEMRQMIIDAKQIATRFVSRIQNRPKGPQNVFD